jgi:hypothetical protein
VVCAKNKIASRHIICSDKAALSLIRTVGSYNGWT